MSVSARHVAVLGRIFFIIGFLIPAVPLVYMRGPWAESEISPVLETGDNVTVPTSVVGQACWDIPLHKLREAAPLYALYTTQLNDQPVSIFVSNGKGVLINQGTFMRHPPGSRWVQRYCADLPEQLRDRPRTLRGTIFFQVPCREQDKECVPHWWRWRPSWWLVPQDLPPIHLEKD